MLSRLRLPVFAAIWCAGVLACVVFGGVLNLVNDTLGPIGFIHNFSPSAKLLDGIVSPAVTQGMQEGFWFGVVAASIISLWAFWVTRAQCPFIFGFKHLSLTVCVTFVFWLVGGVNLLIALLLFPQFVQERVFPNFLSSASGRLNDAWDIGSLWGAYIGSVYSVFFACYKLRRNWHAQK